MIYLLYDFKSLSLLIVNYNIFWRRGWRRFRQLNHLIRLKLNGTRGVSRRFDQWLKISPYAEGDGSADKTRAAFCTFIGSDSFKLLCNLCAPKKPEECTYETLKAKMDAQYGVKQLVLAERYRFYKCKQQEGQSLAIYLAELRKLAVTCDWTEEQLANNLRDKFVMGLHNECLLQQLLTQDHKKPLDELFHFAQTVEAAEKESLRRADNSSTESSVAVMNKSSKKKPVLPSQIPVKKPPAQPGAAKQCASCGGNHFRSTCRFRNAKCHRCGKIGHIQTVCRSQSTAVVQSAHSADSAVVTLSPTQEVKDIPPMLRLVNLPSFSRQLRLVVDSASPITFVNSKTWSDLDRPKLQPTKRVLGAFESQAIHPMGCFLTEISCDGYPKDPVMLQIYVSHNGINILGCDGLTKLNISITPDKYGSVAAIEQEPGIPKALQDVMNVNSKIFKPELGHCVTVKATLILQEGANPKFCKPRKLPFALKPVVGDELYRLEKQGVIKKVSHSEWATCIVVVRKPGGKIRICGDFKVTINPLLKTDVYPLPKPEELFHGLNALLKIGSSNTPREKSSITPCHYQHP